MPKYDVILRGGTILDPANGFEEVADLAILAGKASGYVPSSTRVGPAKSSTSKESGSCRAR